MMETINLLPGEMKFLKTEHPEFDKEKVVQDYLLQEIYYALHPPTVLYDTSKKQRKAYKKQYGKLFAKKIKRQESFYFKGLYWIPRHKIHVER